MSEKTKGVKFVLEGLGNWSECFSVKLVDDQSVVEQYCDYY